MVSARKKKNIPEEKGALYTSALTAFCFLFFSLGKKQACSFVPNKPILLIYQNTTVSLPRE